MSANQLTEKVAVPYARALFDFSIEKNIMHQITADFQNLDIFFNESKELSAYLNNPIINQKAKRMQIEAEDFVERRVRFWRHRLPSLYRGLYGIFIIFLWYFYRIFIEIAFFLSNVRINT